MLWISTLNSFRLSCKTGEVTRITVNTEPRKTEFHVGPSCFLPVNSAHVGDSDCWTISRLWSHRLIESLYKSGRSLFQVPWAPITPYLYTHPLEDSKSAGKEKARMHLDKETHHLFIFFPLSSHHIHFLMGKKFLQSLKFHILFLKCFLTIWCSQVVNQ